MPGLNEQRLQEYIEVFITDMNERVEDLIFVRETLSRAHYFDLHTRMKLDDMLRRCKIASDQFVTFINNVHTMERSKGEEMQKKVMDDAGAIDLDMESLYRLLRIKGFDFG